MDINAIGPNVAMKSITAAADLTKMITDKSIDLQNKMVKVSVQQQVEQSQNNFDVLA